MNDFKTAFDPLNSENQSVNEEINNEGVYKIFDFLSVKTFLTFFEK